MTIRRSKEKLLSDLGDVLSQPEMDDFEDAVEDGRDAYARSIIGSGFNEDEVALLIEEVRRRIREDREKNPVLVGVSDLTTDRLTPKFLRDDIGLLIDVLKLHDAPRPLGRHDRTGLLWRRDVLMAWLKDQKPHPERSKKS